MPGVAVDAQGRATVAWRTFESLETCVRCTADFRIEAVQIGADGTAGPIQTLSPSGEYTSGPAEIGIDSAGTVTVVWIGGYEPGRLLATRIARDGTVGEMMQLSEGW